jgi:hypothetical protein
MAYVLGLLYADGCITTRHGVVWEVTLELKDIEHVKLVASTIDPYLRVHVYTRKDGRQSAKFATGIKTVLEDCLALGLHPRKTFDLQWPKALPEELEGHFIRGYFDGDGTIFSAIYDGKHGRSKRRELSFSCGSPSFADSLCKLIRTHTRAEGRKQQIAKECIKLYYLRQGDIRAIGELMYGDTTLCLGVNISNGRKRSCL